jgi:dihydropteroate synthase
MRSRMTRPTPGGPTPTVLVAAVATLDEASAAVRAGADVVQLTADCAELAAFPARYPGVGFCVAAASDGPARGLTAELSADATMIFADIRSAAASGLPHDRVLVDVPLYMTLAEAAGWPEPDHSPPDRTLLAAGWPEPDHSPPDRTLLAAGWPVLVDADRAALAAGVHADRAAREAGVASADDPALAASVIALAALSCWLGAAAVRTQHVAAVRRALDMANSIRGLRPPTHAVRGLA